MPSPAELVRDLAFARGTASAAAASIQRFATERGRDRAASHKSPRELVTAADLEAERIVREAVAAAFPGDLVLGEEDGQPRSAWARPASTGCGPARRWIVDPIDGTTNYVQRIPMYAVSLALEVDGEIAVGVVHAPALGEEFWASRGGGAWRNGERMRVSARRTVAESVAATGFAYTIVTDANDNTGNFIRIARASSGLRRLGAASLDLAYVADGRLDFYWEFGLKPWDVAAGALLVTEAGGVVTGLGGADWLTSGTILAAATPELHAEASREIEV